MEVRQNEQRAQIPYTVPRRLVVNARAAT